MKENLSSSTKPKLFIAGTQDTKVDPKIVLQGYELAGAPKTLHTIASDHDYRHSPQVIDEINSSIENFLT